jgi:hypothetical protein
MKTAFTDLMDRSHLELLEQEVRKLVGPIRLNSELELVRAMVGAAQEIARCVNRFDSFESHIIEICSRNLGRIRTTYS